MSDQNSPGRPDGRLRVLVTGATGYVGSRLIPELLERGHTVLAGSRRSSGTDGYPWADDVETRELDIDDDEVVRKAVGGVDAVVYLVHSMDDEDFVQRDREAAQRVARACEEAGVQRVLYLSGLVPPGELSDHLRSRKQVEDVLLSGGVPATVLRASMVIGAGSTSYELLRRLSERVPLLTPVPSWLRSTRIQPIAVEDVVTLLAEALEGEPRNDHYDVGGDQVLTYSELLAAFADVAGLRRVQVPVPGVPAWVVGHGCALISRLPHQEVESLIDSLHYDMVCHEDRVRGDLVAADHRYVPVAEALRRALEPGGSPGTSVAGDVQSAAPTDPE